MSTLFSSFPAQLRERLFEKIKGKTFFFPEGSDPRLKETEKLLQPLSVNVVLNAEKHCSDIQLKTKEHLLRKNESRAKKLSEGDIASISQDPFYQGGVLLYQKNVDVVVGGATVPTSHVIRAVLNTIGVRKGYSVLTSCFLFQLKIPSPGQQEIVIYADAGVIPVPNEEQGVEIAALSAEAYRLWTGENPKISFLSFSTQGSAQHADVTKMNGMARRFCEKYPQEHADPFEVQFDAACVPDVAQKKCSSTKIKGATNVFIFPDLNSGNIAYKITQRLAGAQAWGPILLGAAMPYSDLSRGASPADIAHNAILTSLLHTGK